jgi:hypothetical protein
LERNADATGEDETLWSVGGGMPIKTEQN